MRKAHGFTLIELLVTMAIAAVLATLAAPSFVRMLKQNNMSSSVNTFMSDLRFARSESVRLGGQVAICRSDTPEATAPTCSASNANGSGKGWSTGWIVFQDMVGATSGSSPNGAYDEGDRILRVQGPLTNIDAILEGTSTNTTALKFTATGRLQSSDMAVKLVFGGTKFDSTLKRTICLGAGGRARIAGDGSATCGSTNE